MTDLANLTAALGRAPIVPVITIERVADAVPLGRALVAGGLDVLEVTLRTGAALEAISEMKAALPDAIIGAGTICTPIDVDTALAAGADFLVSPGWTPPLGAAMLASGVPCIPGTSTVSEAMSRAEEGFSVLKLFPAVPVGGLSLLRSLAGPLPDLKFMPTGGIKAESATDFLALPNVLAVGGSWMVGADDIAAARWSVIEDKAAAAVKLGQGT